MTNYPTIFKNVYCLVLGKGEGVQYNLLEIPMVTWSKKKILPPPKQIIPLTNFLPTVLSYLGVPLPFGSLGIHKGSDFKDADPCLFIFDCIFYNGENLMNKPLKERRKFLMDNMEEVGNRIKFSEIKEIRKKDELAEMIKDTFR